MITLRVEHDLPSLRDIWFPGPRVVGAALELQRHDGPWMPSKTSTPALGWLVPPTSGG